MTRDDGERQLDSPAIRLLDALAAGDFDAVLSECGETTKVTAENLRWSCQGTDAIENNLADALAAFPGLALEPRVRHVGFGLVIEEARVRDGEATVAATAAEREPSHAASTTDDRYDGPDPAPYTGSHGARSDARAAVDVWHDRGSEGGPPPPLDMPLRLTVRHDDLQVHEITLSFPAALYKRALGLRVDPFEVSLSEIQSAFIAPVGGGFTTHTIARRDLEMPPPPPPEPAVRPPVEEEPPQRRRRGGLALLLVLLVLLAVAGGGWFVLRGNQTASVADPTSSPTTHETHQPSRPPSTSVTTSPEPTARASRTPNVTLKSDLAFGFNSSTLSSAAKAAIATVAKQVLRAQLTGTIYVDGYTDSLGSNAYGKVLSQRRADAVAAYLRLKLGGAAVMVVPVGHGEADPVASNATAAGRVANRRVTLTLPKPS